MHDRYCHFFVLSAGRVVLSKFMKKSVVNKSTVKYNNNYSVLLFNISHQVTAFLRSLMSLYDGPCSNALFKSSGLLVVLLAPCVARILKIISGTGYN